MPVSNAVPLYTDVREIEPYELVETSGLSELVANFARVHILVSLFDADPAKWIEFIERDGTIEERQRDLPFARWMQQRLTLDPSLAPRMRDLVRDFSQLVSRPDA